MPGLAGWTIQLDKDANGTVDATTVTGAGGTYSFTGLTAGTYRVREVDQVGWTQTTVNPGDVTVVSGTNSTGNNFGNFQLGAISGQKFQDNNGDGIKNGADAGLAGWTIQLDKDANGTVDATTVTGAGGNYSFTDSRPARIASAKSARSAGLKRPSIRATSRSSAAPTAPATTSATSSSARSAARSSRTTTATASRTAPMPASPAGRSSSTRTPTAPWMPRPSPAPAATTASPD